MFVLYGVNVDGYMEYVSDLKDAKRRKNYEKYGLRIFFFKKHI